MQHIINCRNQQKDAKVCRSNFRLYGSRGDKTEITPQWNIPALFYYYYNKQLCQCRGSSFISLDQHDCSIVMLRGTTIIKNKSCMKNSWGENKQNFKISIPKLDILQTNEDKQKQTCFSMQHCLHWWLSFSLCDMTWPILILSLLTCFGGDTQHDCHVAIEAMNERLFFEGCQKQTRKHMYTVTHSRRAQK